MSLWETLGKVGTSAASGPLGGLLSLGSTLGGALASIGQTKRQKKLMDYQQQLANQFYDKQWQDQQEQYARELADQRQLIAEEREYNDFSSVMARASKAGINKLAALGQSTGIGMQSAAGSAPSASTPSASSASIPSADNIGANLISAGSTLTAQIRQNALLDAEKRRLEAEAETKEIEAYWKSRDLESTILNREEQTKLYNAGIKEKEAQTRWYTLDSDLKEQEKQFKESMNPMYLDQMRGTLRQMDLMTAKMEFENEHQAEAFRAKMNESRAYVDNVYSMIDERLKNIELRGKELGLSEKQLAEVKAAREQNQSQFERSQSFYEKQDTRRLNNQIAQGYISEANKLVSTMVKGVTDLASIGVNLIDAAIPM